MKRKVTKKVAICVVLLLTAFSEFIILSTSVWIGITWYSKGIISSLMNSIFVLVLILMAVVFRFSAEAGRRQWAI